MGLDAERAGGGRYLRLMLNSKFLPGPRHLLLYGNVNQIICVDCKVSFLIRNDHELFSSLPTCRVRVRKTSLRSYHLCISCGSNAEYVQYTVLWPSMALLNLHHFRLCANTHLLPSQ